MPMIPGNSRLEKIAQKIKQKGFRLTPQRLAVAKILIENEEHLSAQQIYERVKKDFPVTSFATIYKTVALLRDIGEVMELGFVDEGNRYDGARPYPHPHLICLRCKKILDPKIPNLNDLPQKLAKRTGFQITNHRLDFFGLCPECQKGPRP